jgi:hypothetical protein
MHSRPTPVTTLRLLLLAVLLALPAWAAGPASPGAGGGGPGGLHAAGLEIAPAVLGTDRALAGNGTWLQAGTSRRDPRGRVPLVLALLAAALLVLAAGPAFALTNGPLPRPRPPLPGGRSGPRAPPLLRTV